MRPTPEELLQSLRVSLNDALLPGVTDRWARYVGTAMDLVLQHLQLRLAGELDAVQADNTDMSAALAGIAGRAATAAPGPHGQRWQALLDHLAAAAGPPDGKGPLASATQSNEALRRQVVEVLRWLDAEDPADVDDELRIVRDELHRLIRRQVDRVNPLVEPLYMSFRPAVAP
jgi:hypothetical protein